MSKSTIKRCFHECKYFYNEVQTNGYIQKQEGKIKLSQKISTRACTVWRKTNVWTGQIKLNLNEIKMVKIDLQFKYSTLQP